MTCKNCKMFSIIIKNELCYYCVDKQHMDQDVASVYNMTISRLKKDNEKLREENERLHRILKGIQEFFTISKFK